MEDIGPTIIEALERSGFTVVQRYEPAADEWTITAERNGERFIARGSAPTPAAVELAQLAGLETFRNEA